MSKVENLKSYYVVWDGNSGYKLEEHSLKIDKKEYPYQCGWFTSLPEKKDEMFTGFVGLMKDMLKD
jgi:hypothetical protein